MSLNTPSLRLRLKNLPLSILSLPFSMLRNCKPFPLAPSPPSPAPPPPHLIQGRGDCVMSAFHNCRQQKV